MIHSSSAPGTAGRPAGRPPTATTACAVEISRVCDYKRPVTSAIRSLFAVGASMQAHCQALTFPLTSVTLMRCGSSGLINEPNALIYSIPSCCRETMKTTATDCYDNDAGNWRGVRCAPIKVARGQSTSEDNSEISMLSILNK